MIFYMRIDLGTLFQICGLRFSLRGLPEPVFWRLCDPIMTYGQIGHFFELYFFGAGTISGAEKFHTGVFGGAKAIPGIRFGVWCYFHAHF